MPEQKKISISANSESGSHFACAAYCDVLVDGKPVAGNVDYADEVNGTVRQFSTENDRIAASEGRSFSMDHRFGDVEIRLRENAPDCARIAYETLRSPA